MLSLLNLTFSLSGRAVIRAVGKAYAGATARIIPQDQKHGV